MKRRTLRRALFEGKSSSGNSKQKLKKIADKAVYVICYSDENGDEITSYWSSKLKAEKERKSLLEHGYKIIKAFKT